LENFGVGESLIFLSATVWRRYQYLRLYGVKNKVAVQFGSMGSGMKSARSSVPEIAWKDGGISRKISLIIAAVPTLNRNGYFINTNVGL
jgi:hypothetical protein